jgi:signal transduction histidine kinase
MAVWLAKRLQETVIEAEERRKALEIAVESRAKLMRGVSHDLKNPLNAIDGHASLLEDGVRGPINDEQRQSLARIRRAVKTQLTLIKDILDLSRAEADLQIHTARVNLASVATEAVQEQSAAAEAAGHTLIVDCPVQPAVDTDEERVRQVLGNLISNAVKYTPPGGCITVAVEVGKGEGKLAGLTSAEIRVADNGPGIPADKVEAIFQEFTRLDAGAAEGSGLGLAIARRVARLLGGDITVASEAGKGSVFTFWLPLTSAAA